MLSNYRSSSDPGSLEAIYDLRVGYGGNQGPLSNIDAHGFGSMAFHSYPDTLRWDAYSGDYGPNFLGHALGAATYLVEHPIFGLISFGGNVDYKGKNCGLIHVEPKDALRQRIFVAPVSLYVTIDSGLISAFTYNTTSKEVQVSIAGDIGSKGVHTEHGSQEIVLNWEQTAQQEQTMMELATAGLRPGLGGYLIKVSSADITTILFTASIA